ncbi:MAG TPA: hypothetical protein VF995_06985 [Actinomycetota bacterium]
MARINDLGGLQGMGLVPIGDEEDIEPFHADWEARVFALQAVLGRQGLFTTDEFRDAIERMPVREYLRAGYYERWLVALETLLRERGILPDA